MQKTDLPPEKIMQSVILYYGIAKSYLRGPSRVGQIVRPRAMGMYLMRKYTRLSYPEIAAQFARKDHTTVMSAVKKIERQLKEGQRDVLEAVNFFQTKLGLTVVALEFPHIPFFNVVIREVACA